MPFSVIGLARSGLAAANALAARGESVHASDIRSAAQLADYLARLNPHVTVKLGANAFRSGDTLIVSPGIRPTAAIFAEAREASCEVIGEIALFQRLKPSAVPVLAVTGTDGKSTTTCWIGYIMSLAGPCWVGGNLGTPLCESLSRLTEAHTVVAEVSCFQLSTSPEFHPKVAVVTNLAPDHLDYYGGSYEAYQAAKRRLLAHLGPGETAVLNADDPILRTWTAPDGAELVWFSRRGSVERGIFTEDGEIRAAMGAFTGTLIPIHELPLPGGHNLENAMAAAAVALSAGVEVEKVREGLRSFGGLEHRMERVRELDGVTYYNDSKATNPHAAIAGLQAFDESIVLICGGSSKDADFTEWAELAAQRCRHVVACGETAAQMLEALSGRVPSCETETLAEALMAARTAAGGAGVVALSPACASFDQFNNFEHRGEVFKSLVRDLR